MSRITISQPVHIEKTELTDPKNFTKAELVPARAKGAYISTRCRQEVLYKLSKCSQTQETSNEYTKYLNAALSQLKENSDQELTFQKLDTLFVTFMAFSDASFLSNTDNTSQLCYIIETIDSSGKSNIIHYSSVKSLLVTLSVLAEELFFVTNSFDTFSTFKVTFEELYSCKVVILLFTASKRLFGLLICIMSPTDKRSLIDIQGLRETYEVREVVEILWIPSKKNPVDCLTKKGVCAELKQVINVY